jgi:colicin import membrane protein
LLLSWNEKIEKAKKEAELQLFLKTIDTTLDGLERQRQINQQKIEQEQKKKAKKEQIEGLFEKTKEIKTYEEEIILIEQHESIQKSISMSKEIVIGLQSSIVRLETETSIGDNATGSLKQNLERQKLRLEREKKQLEVLEGKQQKIQKILDRENAISSGETIGFTELIPRLKEYITKIENNQKEKETALVETALAEAAATDAAETEAAATDQPLSEKNTANALEREANAAAKASANAAAKASANAATKAAANAAVKASATAAVKAKIKASAEKAAAAKAAAAKAATDQPLRETNAINVLSNAAAKASANTAAKASANAAAAGLPLSEKNATNALERAANAAKPL